MTVQQAIRRLFLAGVATVALLMFGVGGWASVTQISGAVVAPGSLFVASRVQEVQHPTGGIVADILARDGQRVKAGDILVRLDPTLTRANLQIIVKHLDELTARRARLIAERDGAETIVFPDDLLKRESDPDIADLIANERKLHSMRRSARSGQKEQLRERIKQLNNEAQGCSAQSESKAREIALINRELEGARELWNKQLIAISKLTELERNVTRVEGERDQLTAALAQVKGKIAETELQIIQLDLDLSSEVGTELRDIDAKLGELAEKKVAAEDQLKRLEIRAPQDGMVHQSTVHTIGGVISPEKTLMSIVPTSDKLMIEAKVSLADIDQVELEQVARLRFSAFNQRTTPEINGTVSRVAADITTDPRTGHSYYSVDVTIQPQEVARLGAVKLVPGMPVEVFIKTGDRHVISYLVKPLNDQIARAFREQ